MASGFLPHSLSIRDTSTTNGGQSFAGVNLGTINYAGSHNGSDADTLAAIACRSALFLTDPNEDREKVISAKGTRVAGTCKWITHDAKYRAWLSSSNNNGYSDDNESTHLLWMSGGPGKGKTMMSVFLTEELERHTACRKEANIVFFFCSAEDEKRNTAVAVLRGLVHQIITKRPPLVKHALPYFETPERTQQTLSSLETLWIIFSKLVADAQLGTMLCVLDGLDECEDGTLRALVPRIVSLLTGDTLELAIGVFKLAIVSRDIPGLQGCAQIRLDPDNDDKVTGDIELFVSARVQELSRIEGFDNDFRASVQTALLKRAKGTFLWVGFAMHELLQKQTCSEIWEALEELPSGLPAVYSRMLLRIPAKQKEMSRAILRWVTLAARPLQLRELAAAVGVQAASPQITVEQAARDAVALCGPLLKVQNQEVSLVHQSARDYLLWKERDSDGVPEAFRLEAESAHLELAQKCLECIAQSDLQHKAIDLDDEPDPQESPLLRYATLQWPEHAKSCSALAAKLFDPSGLFLQKESSLRVHWWTSYSKWRSGYLSDYPPLLHMACSVEILPWIKAVLAKKSWRPRYHRCVDKKNIRGETALHLAARGGNVAVVRLLVDKGADVKAKDNDGETVLHSAATGGNKVVVRLLVDKGADVEVKDNGGNTALHSAALEGNKAVVRLLVDKGADVEAKDNGGNTALHSAALEGNEAVVRLLVDKGADVEAKDNGGNTALHSAALEGNEAVVRLLVDKGADVEAKDNDGNTALYWAARGGHEVIVRLLVDRGADVEAKDLFGLTVLHSAVRERHEAVVQLLVDKGADIEAKDLFGLSVLHSAVRERNEAVVRLLVDKGADVKAKDKYKSTVLHSAARAGNEAVVRLLVDKGADVEARDNDGNTALHRAAWGWNKSVVRLLVDKGADVEAKNNDGNTALHKAARRGNVVVVRLLVDKGADVKAKDKYKSTVLHLAAQAGNEAIVQLLVDKGADVEAKDNDGNTALYWAAREGMRWWCGCL